MKKNILSILKRIVVYFTLFNWVHSVEMVFLYGNSSDRLKVLINTILLVLALVGVTKTKILKLTFTKFEKLSILFVLILNFSLFFLYISIKPKHVFFNNKDYKKTLNYVEHKKKSPDLDILIDNDSVLVLGIKKQRKRNLEIMNLSQLRKNPYYNDDFGEIYFATKFVPTDFKSYRKLINPESPLDKSTLTCEYLQWQFPKHILVVYLKNCKCRKTSFGFYPNERRTKDCIMVLNEKRESIKQLRAVGYLVKYGFSSRYRAYKKVFKEYLFPEYDLSEEYKNDPYFLILQNRIKEAKKRLKDLPKKRRVFCRKKIKKLQRSKRNKKNK